MSHSHTLVRQLVEWSWPIQCSEMSTREKKTYTECSRALECVPGWTDVCVRLRQR